MKLNSLRAGDTAKVASLTELPSQLKKKLLVMGLLPDTEITLIRRAPMGDPLQVEVRGVTMALSSSVASQVEVEAV